MYSLGALKRVYCNDATRLHSHSCSTVSQSLKGVNHEDANVEATIQYSKCDCVSKGLLAATPKLS